jgi:hypothetical protein
LIWRIRKPESPYDRVIIDVLIASRKIFSDRKGRTERQKYSANEIYSSLF